MKVSYKGFIDGFSAISMAVAGQKPVERRRSATAKATSKSSAQRRSARRPAVLAALLALGATDAGAADSPDPGAYVLTIKAHKFEPAELTVPANTKVRVLVKNADSTPEEFESYELKREKVIAGNSEATIFIGPLAPGTYPFFGDFNQDTAKGQIIAK